MNYIPTHHTATFDKGRCVETSTTPGEFMRSITVRITNNYGNQAVYPVCDTAKKLADLVGAKTFTPATIDKLLGLGYTLNVQQQELAWSKDRVLGESTAAHWARTGTNA